MISIKPTSKRIQLETPTRISFQDRSDIHIWIVELNSLKKEEIDFISTNLNEEEIAKEKRFRFTADRKRYVLTHGLKRFLIGKYLNVLPESLSFYKNKFKKPFVENNSENLNFSISYSNDLLGIAVGFGKYRMGLDIEKIDPVFDYSSIVSNYFTSAEKARLRKDQSNEFFYSLWTRKEAVMKALGTGLSNKIANISVHNNSLEIIDYSDRNQSNASSKFNLSTYRYNKDYQISLAHEMTTPRVRHVKFSF